MDPQASASWQRPAWVAALVAVLLLPMLYPTQAPFIADEPLLLRMALEENKAGTLATAGLTGPKGRRYGPGAIWVYQAILLVTATASVGYDLDGMGLDFDEASRTVRFTGMGEPTLLSLQHDVRYYDLDEGTFNAFSAADHTRMNAQAKERILARLPRSGLFEKAREQRTEFLSVLSAVVEHAGWRFVDEAAPLNASAPQAH